VAPRVSTLATLGTGALYAAAWLPDGTLIVDTALGLRRFDTQGQPLGDYLGPQPPLRLLAVLPDGRLLLGKPELQEQSQLTIFDLDTNNAVSVAIPPTSRVLAASDGGLLALNAVAQVQATPNELPVNQDQLLIVDTSGSTLLTVPDRSPGVLAFSPDRQLLAVDNVDYALSTPTITIDIMDITSGQLRQTLRGLQYVPDEIHFAAESLIVRENGGATSVWDLASGQRQRDLGSFHDVVVSADGTQLSALDGTSIRRWSLLTGEELLTLPSSSAAQAILNGGYRSARLTFAPDGSHLLASSAAGLALWRLADGDRSEVVVHFTSPLRQLAFAPDGAMLATAGSVDTQLWDVATGAVHWRQQAMQPAFAFAPDGASLLLTARSANGDDELRSHDRMGSPLAALSQRAAVTDLVFSPSGAAFATAQTGVALRDAASGATLRSFETAPTMSGSLSGMAGRSGPAFSPDATLIAVGVDEQARIFDVASGAELRRFTHHSMVSRVQQVLFSPDGALLASVAYDSIVLWDVANSREQRAITLADANRFFSQIAFSPDGRLLAVGTWLNGGPGDSSDLRLFDVASGNEVATRHGHLGLISTVAFAPDGALLASGSADGTVRLWGIE
jgi:WD40 repeat protein